MPIDGKLAAGRRGIVFELDPRTALDVFFGLAASLQAEETTLQQRITIAGLLPQLKRAVARTGVVRLETLDDYQRHLLTKPAPPPLDNVIRSLSGGD